MMKPFDRLAAGHEMLVKCTPWKLPVPRKPSGPPPRIPDSAVKCAPWKLLVPRKLSGVLWGSQEVSLGHPESFPRGGDHFTETFWSKTVCFKGKTVQNLVLGSFQNTHFASCAEETFWGSGQISWNSGEVYTLETSCAEETFWAAGQIS